MIQGDQAIVKLIMKSFNMYQEEILQLEEEEIIQFVKFGHIYVKAFQEYNGPGGLLGM